MSFGHKLSVGFLETQLSQRYNKCNLLFKFIKFQECLCFAVNKDSRVRTRKGRVQARINYTLQGLKVMCIRGDNIRVAGAQPLWRWRFCIHQVCICYNCNVSCL